MGRAKGRRGIEAMAWRIQGSHREETKAVKAALDKAGIRYKRVGHGTGTAWGWLHIKLAGHWDTEASRAAILVAQEATGRHGDYDGCINTSFAA